jgi:plastocyanin
MTRHPRLRILTTLAALALLVPACGDGAGGADQPAAAVEIRDFSFAPAQLEVAAGQQVQWTNTDSAPHTVTFDDPGVDSSDELAEGEQFSTALDRAGEYRYICALHPQMQAVVTVTG